MKEKKKKDIAFIFREELQETVLVSKNSVISQTAKSSCLQWGWS